MAIRDREEETIHPEQYDALETEAAKGATAINRRKFFKLLGGGLAIAITYSDLFASQASTALAPGAAKPDEGAIAAWIHIDENGLVKVFTGKVEVGQNIRTSLAQVVAEELAVPVHAIEMVMGDTDLTPYDRGTFGSRTTPYMGPQLRKAAASLKESLIAMAAKEWHADKRTLMVKDGRVINTRSNQSLDYAALTKGKEVLLPVNDQVALTPVNEWKVAGTSVPKVNGKDFITGKHKYVSDMVLPGMVYGKVLRAPAYGASLAFADTQQARLVPEVTVVEEDGFVGVTAPDPQTAENALVKIDARWDTTVQPAKAEIFEFLKNNTNDREDGENEEAQRVFAAAATQLKQAFEVQYIAHAPLEPRAALATWEEGHLTVWTGTQRPFGVQEELERAFSLPKGTVRVIMPDTGSGYGGKHSGEAAVEAARLSKAAGKPVKIVWTREEEFKWAYFRPAGLIEVQASADNRGMLSSWEFHNYNSGNAGIELPYEVSTKHIRFHRSTSPLKQGSYRGLAATANVFAIENMINDMAAQLQQDPLEFRLNHLKDTRLKDVLQATAEKFGWNNKKAGGHGQGIACGFVKNAYIATCAEVEYHQASGELKILRIVAAFECGTIINPKHLESQVMGCILQGLGGALFEEVDFKDGRILNPTFSTYRVPRFKDIPALEIILLNRTDIEPIGAGETPIVALAPAIRSAIYDATGAKINTLPMVPNGLKV